jgi:hypothetical protein
MHMATMMTAMMMVFATTVVMIWVFTMPYAALHNGAHNARAAIQCSGSQVYHAANDAHNTSVIWLGIAMVVIVIHN